jgi:hypothetical protein
MTYTVTVTEPTEHVDRTLATASWWDRYMIQPGTYAVEFVSIGWHPCPAGQRPYYALVRLDARLTESYRVNRLLHHTSAQTEHPDRATTLTLSTYAYEVKPDTTHLFGFPLTHTEET